MNTTARLTKATIIRSAIVISALIVIGILIWLGANDREESNTIPDADAPTFSAILPANTPIESLGGWQKLTPPNSEPVYVFVDMINGTSVNVSQQELPASFKNNTDIEVSHLAKGYNANDTFDANGTKVYIGTSAEGPQSVIFTKNGLLILMKSQKQMSNDAWAAYINSLI